MENINLLSLHQGLAGSVEPQRNGQLTGAILWLQELENRWLSELERTNLLDVQRCTRALADPKIHSTL